jgi:hypothetical protein
MRSPLLILLAAAAGCLPSASFSGPGSSQADLGAGTDAASPATSGPNGATGTAYFNPDIQADLDKLGCTASACHGANSSPQIIAKPASAADWQSNWTNIHIDCTTLDCLGGGASSLLLTKPLQGGPSHTGTKPFASTSDPTYQRWLAWLTAGAPYDAAGSLAAPGSQDMTSAPVDMAGTDLGKLERMTITFTATASPNAAKSGYAPKNVDAVWIETSGGAFVKTIGRWANARRQYLLGWIAKAGNADVDAVSGASQGNYMTLTATWDMTARAGLPAPVDGVYTIRLELADGDVNSTAQNNEGTFTFNRNGTASTQTMLTNGGFTKVTITYTGR